MMFPARITKLKGDLVQHGQLTDLLHVETVPAYVGSLVGNHPTLVPLMVVIHNDQSRHPRSTWILKAQ